MKKYNVFISIFVLFLMLNMILAPKLYLNATKEGLNLWANKVVPSVLVFMFLVKLFITLSSNCRTSPIAVKLCHKLWNCPALSLRIFLCSILSGYPVGAMMISDQYMQGKITRSQAGRMCGFCSNSGPMFIVGAVGLSMFGNAKLGFIILASHIIGAIINGFLYKNINLPEMELKQTPINHQKFDLSAIVGSTFSSVLSIGVIIAVFFVVITFFQPLIQLLPAPLSQITEGLIEITKGCQSISQNLSGISALLSATFVISFGGFSTIVQSIALLGKINLPIKVFVLQKFSHALISTIVAGLLFFII